MTPAEIVARLRAVAAEMESLGAAMDYFGGFDGRMTHAWPRDGRGGRHRP